MRSYPSIGCKLKLSLKKIRFFHFGIFSHGYDGTKDQTKTIYTVSENEILYVIGSVCILYEPDTKQQRFYTKHNSPITW
jgi:hypothetical protein